MGEKRVFKVARTQSWVLIFNISFGEVKVTLSKSLKISSSIHLPLTQTTIIISSNMVKWKFEVTEIEIFKYLVTPMNVCSYEEKRGCVYKRTMCRLREG